MKTVKFIHHCGKYQVGEIAAFSEDIADLLVSQLYAEYFTDQEETAFDSIDSKHFETQSKPRKRGRKPKNSVFEELGA